MSYLTLFITFIFVIIGTNINIRRVFGPISAILHLSHNYTLTLWRRNFLLNFSTSCIENVNNTGTKKR